MTPETAWAEAMKFENRPNPYPFFDELRKTPVARVVNGIYVVTGYRELVALAHDPRVSSDMSHSPVAGQRGSRARGRARAGQRRTVGQRSMITSDPPDHDRMRRQAMRHFGPPHSPDLIPSMEPDIQRLCNDCSTRSRARPGSTSSTSTPIRCR